MVLKNLERKVGSVKIIDLPIPVREELSRFWTAKKDLAKVQRSAGESFDAAFNLAYPRPREPSYRDIAIGNAQERLNGAVEAISHVVYRFRNKRTGVYGGDSIYPHIEKGATHVHIGTLGRTLHFVKLPAKHSGKFFKPIIGNVRIPIHEG